MAFLLRVTEVKELLQVRKGLEDKVVCTCDPLHLKIHLTLLPPGH